MKYCPIPPISGLTKGQLRDRKIITRTIVEAEPQIKVEFAEIEKYVREHTSRFSSDELFAQIYKDLGASSIDEREDSEDV